MGLYLLFFTLCVCSTGGTIITPIISPLPWKIQSSAIAKQSGSVISAAGFSPTGWHEATVPSTVVGSLVQSGYFKDPFFGFNFQDIMNQNASFTPGWWYRLEWTPYTSDDMSTLVLRFQGLNYKADVWVNGKQLGDHSTVAGVFRYFDFDVTSHIKRGSTNVVAVLCYRPYDGIFAPHNNSTDLSISFVDWAPHPPDGSMGLWRDVLLIENQNQLNVQYPLVDTKLSTTSEGDTMASLKVAVDVKSYNSTNDISGYVHLQIPSITSKTLTVPVTVNAQFDVTVTWTSDQFSELNVTNPDLWWPWQLGKPTLHPLKACFGKSTVYNPTTDSDCTTAKFGIRQVTDHMITPENYRYFKVNGKNFLVMGAGYTPDLLLRYSNTEMERHIDMSIHMGLNTIRMEGKMPPDYWFDYADQKGMMLMPGWCCCDAWQHWPLWKQQQYEIARASMRTQARRQRIHPSVLVFLYGSDQSPPADVEKMYLQELSAAMWPNPSISGAANDSTSVTGWTGVKMSGPYAWEPPGYWLADENFEHKKGGAFGFLTEAGPGASPLTMTSLHTTLPKSDWWPINADWDFHCANPKGVFHDLRFFTPALDGRYGPSANEIEYTFKAQVQSYECHKAMFEAYSIERYNGNNEYDTTYNLDPPAPPIAAWGNKATGLIQWMLNNPWPSNMWHLYDYYWTPGGAFFGTRSANQPVHTIYNDNTNSLATVVNQELQMSDITVVAELRNVLKSSEHIWVKNFTISSSDLGYNKVYNIPESIVPIEQFKHLLDVCYFLRIRTYQQGNTMLDSNLYWLSLSQDHFDWKDSTFYNTPVKKYADFLTFNALPKIDVKMTVLNNEPGMIEVEVANTDHTTVAFFTYVRLVSSAGDEVNPVFWDDNYITLFPGEKRVLKGTWEKKIVSGATKPIVEVANNVFGKQ